ncbi:hypothetical protein VFPFJ_00200 [Purpureocillium lilacinum]|uniref:Uncharacterized protein n=1 Tax=Purpureocillium lilacinum TaxID=33203 RepID=A0A179HW27_PURLI|nr:hypothetical protein VFPFJ_00200 [Purpureocillium lilacinum]OAQ94092.1 hypothetical protein VFPFJ_00200 [Purpureocillium lilacinum]
MQTEAHKTCALFPSIQLAASRTTPPVEQRRDSVPTSSTSGDRHLSNDNSRKDRPRRSCRFVVPRVYPGH